MGSSGETCWERALIQIAQTGYSYVNTSYVDIPTGKQFSVVDAFKEDGPRIAVAKPTMTEAVHELMMILGIKIENNE
jgi:hypothetical protein